MSNLKPFDIEAVKAGKKFVHESGRVNKGYCITEWGIVVLWDRVTYGTFIYPEDYHYLRMAPEEKEVWINVWKDELGDILVCECYTEEDYKADLSEPDGHSLLETIHRKYEI